MIDRFALFMSKDKENSFKKLMAHFEITCIFIKSLISNPIE